MRQRKKENGRRKNCKELRGKKLKMQACIMENMKVGNRLCTIPNPPPLHPSSHVLSLWHWERRFGGDKLRYFISDVTNARCCYRVCSSFFRMDGRNKDRPRLCRHHGFGSVLRRAVSYQLINFLYKFTALDHFDGFQFLPGSTAWIITEHIEVFNRASKWGWSKTIKKKSLPRLMEYLNH